MVNYSPLHNSTFQNSVARPVRVDAVLGWRWDGRFLAWRSAQQVCALVIASETGYMCGRYGSSGP